MTPSRITYATGEDLLLPLVGAMMTGKSEDACYDEIELLPLVGAMMTPR